ncbi:hypothetical protein GQ53DRAFT_747576 [Thozetella sp. PMI_491]|nr:hypothetical protein GQ53DRAFT_747576 [Thozetella sp. PMI_491]
MAVGAKWLTASTKAQPKDPLGDKPSLAKATALADSPVARIGVALLDLLLAVAAGLLSNFDRSSRGENGQREDGGKRELHVA